MLHIQWLREALSWASLPVLLLLAGIIYKRRLIPSLPLFFAYVVVAALADIIRLTAYIAFSQSVYFYVYWISDVVCTFFNFLAIYELFLKRLFAGFLGVGFYRSAFPVVATLVTFLGWLTALQAPSRSAGFFIAARTFDFLRVAVLAFFLILMQFMRREWSRHAFGIAFGFGIHASACLIAEAMWTRAHYRPTIVDQLPLIGFELAALIWLIAFIQPEHEKAMAHAIHSGVLEEARTWQSMLKGWLNHGNLKRNRPSE